MKFYLGVTDNKWFRYLWHRKPEDVNLSALLLSSEGKVRLLHQQHELSNAVSLNWKRNEKFSALAVGEAAASKPMLNTNLR